MSLSFSILLEEAISLLKDSENIGRKYAVTRFEEHPALLATFYFLFIWIILLDFSVRNFFCPLYKYKYDLVSLRFTVLCFFYFMVLSLTLCLSYLLRWFSFPNSMSFFFFFFFLLQTAECWRFSSDILEGRW